MLASILPAFHHVSASVHVLVAIQLFLPFVGNQSVPAVSIVVLQLQFGLDVDFVAVPFGSNFPAEYANWSGSHKWCGHTA